jgi:hypothetical protein
MIKLKKLLLIDDDTTANYLNERIVRELQIAEEVQVLHNGRQGWITSLPTGNRYPYFNNNNLQTAYYLDESFVSLLQDLRDPRLFRLADRAPQGASLPENDFSAYGGLKGSAALDENSQQVVAGEASKIAPRYYNNPVNEPSLAVGYAELQFILAEAVVRGWISGDAASFYRNGIEASMAFYKVPEAAIAEYLAREEVQLQAGKELEMILTQKYIAFL